MKKSSKIELTWDQTQKIIALALEERNPYDAVKKVYGLEEKAIVDIMKSKLTSDKFDVWKKKANAAKPKPKQIKIDNHQHSFNF